MAGEMSQVIPPTREALAEAGALAAEIVRNIELTELPLANIALKATRLARLLNEWEYHATLQYEVSGYPYPSAENGKAVWIAARRANREYRITPTETNKAGVSIYLDSIESLEATIKRAESALLAAQDSPVSVSSANPNQRVYAGAGNRFERETIRNEAKTAAQRVAARRAFVYEYALSKHLELRYSEAADDIFSRVRERVDNGIGVVVPRAVEQFNSVYGNLRSVNPENWANAVHSCRRILQALADALFPATEVTRIKRRGAKQIEVKLGTDFYINRLVAFAEDRSDSEKFAGIVGSDLGYLGDRLDSIFEAAQKGSHASVTRAEADRYVVATYLVVGDLLTLRADPSGPAREAGEDSSPE